MEKNLKDPTTFIENALETQSEKFDWRALSEYNLMQIGFFQHERLVHLLVTFFFGAVLISFAISGLTLMNIWLLAIAAISLVLLGFYVRHYFVLENGVQKLYSLEREILARFEQSVSG